jgi:hypothetical protein
MPLGVWSVNKINDCLITNFIIWSRWEATVRKESPNGFFVYCVKVANLRLTLYITCVII